MGYDIAAVKLADRVARGLGSPAETNDSGVAVRTEDYGKFTFANLPLPNVVPVGSRAYATDLQQHVVNDGTTWTPYTGMSTAYADVIYAGQQRFGGYWDAAAGHDDMPAIELAAAEAATFSPRKAIMLPPIVGAGSSAYIPSEVHVIGYNYSPGKINTRVIPLAAMSLSTGFIFNLNTTDGTTQEETQDWGARGYWNGIYGVMLDNATNNVAQARLCTFAWRFAAADIAGRRSCQLIKKVAGIYTDNTRIDNVWVQVTNDNSEYQIEITSGGGDCLQVNNVNVVAGTGTGYPIKAISVSTGNNPRIDNIVNGTIYFQNCHDAVVSNLHQEAGQVLFEDTSGTIRDMTSQVHDEDTYYPIDLTTTGGAVATYPVHLDNVIFKQGALGFDGTVVAEVRLTAQHTLTSTNSYRFLGIAGEHATTGFRIAKGDDSLLTAWNNNAGYLSLNGSVSGYIPHGSDNATLVADYLGVFNAVVKVTGNGDSDLDDGTTYYYSSQFLIDNTAGRLIGQNETGGELSVLMTAANQRNYIPISYGTCSRRGILRMYRGEATGSYNFKADIPVNGLREVGDQGTYVSGVPWEARGAAAVDTIEAVEGNFTVTPSSGALMDVAYEGPNVVNADATIGSPAALESTVILGTALTADRSYTINSAITRVGSRVRLVRNNAASGAFNALLKNPAGTTMKTMATNNTWAVAELCTGSVWRLVAYGAL